MALASLHQEEGTELNQKHVVYQKSEETAEVLDDSKGLLGIEQFSMTEELLEKWLLQRESLKLPNLPSFVCSITVTV